MTTDLYTDDIRAAVETLRRGGIILYPTDAVWGIGCDATNAAAVARVFDIKRRTDAKALITLVDSVAALERLVDDIPDAAYQLIDVAVEPLTIVYDSAHGVAPQLRAADGSIGVRITEEPFSRRLCHTLRKPLVSTSANVSGDPTPLCFSDITPQIIQAVDYVCLSRRDESPAAKASTIIKVSAGNVIHLIRK